MGWYNIIIVTQISSDRPGTTVAFIWIKFALEPAILIWKQIYKLLNEMYCYKYRGKQGED